MTAQTDLDGKLRAWLDLMPAEAPDRAIAAVLQAVEATPQPRATFRWPTWRPVTMNRIFVAVGAMAAVAIVGVLLLNGQANQATVGTSPSPAVSAAAAASIAAPASASPSVSPSAGASSNLGSLAGRWMGGHSSFVGPGQGSSMAITADSLNLSAANDNGRPLMTAVASWPSPDQMRLTTVSGPGCSVGDVGTYTWTRSTSGRVLALRAVSDACAARGAALTGTWWQSVCRNPETDCLGDLDPGTYASQYIVPRLAAGTAWTPEFGGITYTVPDGWANSQDWPSTFTLTPSASYALEDASGPPGTLRHEIYVFTDPAANVQDAACDGRPDPNVKQSVDALAGWIARQPSLTATKAAPVTIGGQSGKMIDISMRPGYAKSCPGDTSPSVGLFGPAGTPQNGWGFGLITGEHVRLILLDLGGGHVIGIAIDDSPAAGTSSDFESLVQAATPVVESFRFGARS